MLDVPCARKAVDMTHLSTRRGTGVATEFVGVASWCSTTHINADDIQLGAHPSTGDVWDPLYVHVEPLVFL